mgnify:CR=1 FL=1
MSQAVVSDTAEPMSTAMLSSSSPPSPILPSSPDFERYDAVRAEVMMDKHTNKPRGFGFVYFKDESALKDAIRDMHEKVRALSCFITRMIMER